MCWYTAKPWTGAKNKNKNNSNNKEMALANPWHTGLNVTLQFSSYRESLSDKMVRTIISHLLSSLVFWMQDHRLPICAENLQSVIEWREHHEIKNKGKTKYGDLNLASGNFFLYKSDFWCNGI